MRTTIIHSEKARAAIETWVDACHPRRDDGSPAISLQALRERAERILCRSHDTDTEILMRTPHAALAGETPWEMLYHSPGGIARLENILDLLDQGRLVVLPVVGRYRLPERRAV